MSVPFDEHTEFLRIITEKSKIAKFPININQACERFKRERGSPLSVPGLAKRIERYREQIPFMNELDIETRARMMFALRAPVNAWFLRELQKYAEVELDYRLRIIGYETKGGGLKLGVFRKREANGADPERALNERIHAILEGAREESEGPAKRARMSMESEQLLYEGEDPDYFPLVSHEEQKPEFFIEDSGTSESTSRVRDLLILLRGPVSSIESPSLTGLLRKMEGKIQKSEENNKQFSLENINIPFDACLFLLMGNAVPKCPPEQESISLRDFLISLKTVTSHIHHPSIHPYHQKLKEVIIELAECDKRIPVEIVCSAMETVLNIIAP